MRFRNNKPAFTLAEVLVALAIFAMLATPLFIAQGVILRGVANSSWLVQRIFFAEKFLTDSNAEDTENNKLTLEKKIQSPDTNMHYSRSPVGSKSQLHEYEGLLVEKVEVNWVEMGQKKADTVLNFIYKPERKQQ